VSFDRLFSTPVQGVDSDERYTPQWVFDGLGMTFDVDPCSPVDGGDCVPAINKYTLHDDGLSQEWNGTAWVNPPFSNATAWADRFRKHANGVFLGPVANSRWAVDLERAADLLWLCRDFAFTHPTHAGRRSSMPLMFVAMGVTAVSALQRLATKSGHQGALLVNWEEAAGYMNGYRDGFKNGIEARTDIKEGAA
jgi:hypothetical protein